MNEALYFLTCIVGGFLFGFFVTGPVRRKYNLPFWVVALAIILFSLLAQPLWILFE